MVAGDIHAVFVVLVADYAEVLRGLLLNYRAVTGAGVSVCGPNLKNCFVAEKVALALGALPGQTQPRSELT